MYSTFEINNETIDSPKSRCYFDNQILLYRHQIDNIIQGLEAYLRHSMTMLNHATSASTETVSTLPPPMLVMLDTSRPRINLLQQYVNHGSIHDPIAISSKNLGYDQYTSGQTPDEFIQSDSSTPIGFQNWTIWGAPKGSPGQSKWHPKYKEHELIGWMLAMHFLEAMDSARDVISQSPLTWEKDIIGKWWDSASAEAKLPAPTNSEHAKGHSLSSLLFGVPGDSEGDATTAWRMNPIHCRTTFQHIEHGNLIYNIASGVSKASITQDIMETRDAARWSEGWVWDIGDLERKTKIKLQRYGGLGYIDMKTALYGIPSSGTLKIFLPFHADQEDDIIAEEEDVHRFKSLVVCEVNEKRGDKECNLALDVVFVVGQVSVKAETIEDAANYLNKPICVRVPVPASATVSEPPPASMEQTVGGEGLLVEMTVTRPDITVKDGACSVSHVVWET
jgi:hypothetical protein